uniref:Uncharacterized protein n=1 Tax=Candidatus Kentrum sp. FW TaxID=2126338 RepID=A0A450TTE9_9GAMM|nr:MAG: hypothetical protein BECKFW1821B_GA0114236_12483 [Candidatus Kentron sp. FW]
MRISKRKSVGNTYAIRWLPNKSKEEDTEAMKQILMLMQLKGVGLQSSWILVMEFFAWRSFKNRRQLAGLRRSFANAVRQRRKSARTGN